MITDGKKWHYLAVKNLSALFREITSNHVGEFYCLNCLHSFRAENKLKRHKNVCKSHEYCYILLKWLKKNNSISKNNHEENYENSLYYLC